MGPGAVPGEWADVCGEYTVRFLSRTVHCVFVKKIKVVTRKYGCILHLLTFAVTKHRGINTISAHTSKNDPLRTNATEEDAGHMVNEATIRTRHNRPYEKKMLP